MVKFESHKGKYILTFDKEQIKQLIVYTDFYVSWNIDKLGRLHLTVKE